MSPTSPAPDGSLLSIGPGGQPQHLRAAGRAALVAAAVFLSQPLSAAFLPVDLEEITDPAMVRDHWWMGTLMAVEFTAMGVAGVVLALALHRAVAPTSSTLRTQFGLVCGLVAATAWLLEGAHWGATFSQLMPDVAALHDDPGVRAMVLFAMYAVGYGFTGLACLGTAGWLVGVLPAARRAGVVGRAVTVVGWVVAVLLVLGVVSGYAIPTAILHVPLWAVLGVRLLRTAAAMVR